jgi:hypothetical protein
LLGKLADNVRSHSRSAALKRIREKNRMRLNRTIKIVYSALFLVSLLLTACGGGGGTTTVIDETPNYTIGGMISGLVSSAILQDNGGNNLTVSANGSLTFTAKVASGSGYNVSVLTQPSGQTCTVGSGSGTILANVTNVAVVCSNNSGTVSGSVTGLTGSLVLQDNGGDNLSVAAIGAFTFATSITNGNTYNVSVLTQPAGQTCSVSAGAGTISGNSVSNVVVVCSTNTYNVGGTVSGLAGSMVLQDNNGDNLTVAANGTFTFATQVANGSPYSVTVLTQPTGQTCNITSGGGTVTANVTSVAVNCSASSLALFVGNMYGKGNLNGTGAAVRFFYPTSGATDSAGNVYVADNANSLIRKITPAGAVTTLAGTAGIIGSADGTGTAASFNGPTGIATDSAGNVYVADTSNNTIRKITPAGVVTTLAGTAGVTGHADGAGAAASFNHPTGIATDSAANVYVVDTNNNTIRMITPAGVVSTLAGTAGIIGHADGTGAAASFAYPEGVATDSAANVYVADTNNNTIRKITPTGVVTTLAGTAGVTGHVDGSGAAASFSRPYGVATDSANNVYVADANNNNIRMVTLAGVVTTLAGTAGVTGSADGTGATASFNFPASVATDSAGNVYVADYFNSTIRKITPAAAVTTLAGAAAVTGYADGTGATASFNSPAGVGADSTGNVYVADTYNNTIRKITPAGVVTTLAGTAGVIGHADGTGAAASFYYPRGIATNSAGNVYVADYYNSTIREITPAGVVTTLAGTAGVFGHADGTGVAASFDYVVGVATDSAGNIYVTDGNEIIRKITPAGVVTTLAGTAGIIGHADGTGAAASFSNPSGITTDSVGDIYVADSNNGTLRKITPAGVVTTLAGTAGGFGHADGTGAAASFSNPSGIATDSASNIYVADTGNSTIRKITPTGVVTTVVGVVGMLGFAPGALPGVLLHPGGVVISGTSLYITNYNGVAVVTNVP